MRRQVLPEMLDRLPADDPAARASRSDLVRINRLMGHARMVRRQLRALFGSGQIRSVLELGAGEGTLLAAIIRQSDRFASAGRVVLLDQNPAVSPSVTGALTRRGWQVQIVRAEAVSWLSQAGERFDWIFANLFVHHFADGALQLLLRHTAERTDGFIACEPRRNLFALGAACALRWLRCHPVTCHDARVSVRAGFRGRELSAAWPGDTDWIVQERPAGLFSHLFSAQRRSVAARRHRVALFNG